MRWRFPGMLAVLATFVWAPPADAQGAQARRPILAVFDVQSQGVKLDRDVLDRLANYLSGQLAGSRLFQVIPRSQVKERLARQKAESYRDCYDQTCQIELGRELAAEKTVSTEVIRLAGQCMVNLTLYDLRTAAAESASTGEGTCSEEGIVRSLKTAIENLLAPPPGAPSGAPAPKPVPAPAPAPTPAPAPAPSAARPVPDRPAADPGPGPSPAGSYYFLDVDTSPAGASVLLDGEMIGLSPVRARRVAAGPHLLRLEKGGFEPVEKRVRIQKDTVLSEGMNPLASLDVRFKPDGARVLVDGVIVGETPVKGRRLVQGAHLIRVEAPERLPEERPLVLTGAPVTLEGELPLDAAAVEQRMTKTDWVRFTAMLGLTGMGGGELAFFGLKWPSAYWIVLHGGGIGGLTSPIGGKAQDIGFWTFVGTEAGWSKILGNHWIGVGLGLGWGLMVGHNRDSDYESVHTMGLDFTPTFRWRYYWDRKGLELSLRWPWVLGTGHSPGQTVWPVLGIGIGL